MSQHQEYKIEVTWSDGRVSEVFFFEHCLHSARYHAMRYIDRNKDKLSMKLYKINERAFGPRWKMIESHQLTQKD